VPESEHARCLRSQPQADTLIARVQSSVVARHRPHAWLAAAAVTFAAGAAHAGRPTPLVTGEAALDRARAAWAQADFEAAQSAYQEAITRGGLSRTDVIDAYSHLGAAHFIVGKRDLAANAFRVAATVDPSFVVPAEAGKKAAALAEAQRKQTVPFKLEAGAPDHVASGASFAVNVLFDAAQLPLLARIGIIVRDPATAKTYRFEEQPKLVVTFRVPSSMTLPGADLDVRVDALDDHDNQLAVASTRVTVSGAPVAATSETEKPSGGTSFWKSPWPYVIGGTLLAAGGVGLYFAVRSPSEVNVGAPHVQTN